MTKLKPLLREFTLQARNPPGNDAYITSCYQAASELASSANHPLNTLLREIIASRPQISAAHLVNLWLRSIQYLELWKIKSSTYPHHLHDTTSWIQETETILKIYPRQLKNLLLTKDTGTTLYQRYTGPKAIISSLFPVNHPVSLIDLGCGGMHGVLGLLHREPFAPVTDLTPNRLFTSWINRPHKLGLGVGVDKQLPFAEDSIRWRIACSLYPSEFNRLDDYLKLEKRMRHRDSARFVRADLTKPYLHCKRLPPADIVTISSVLYQSPERQTAILKNAKSLLSPSGILIVNEFAQKSATPPAQLQIWGSDWFKKPFGYRTFITGSVTNGKFWEVFQFYNGRCTQVKAGKDFNKFANIIATHIKEVTYKC